MRHAHNLSNIAALSRHPAMLAVAIAFVACASTSSAHAQSSSLPATNMGKFVHQPGDNQYSDRTQSERHAPPPPPPRPTAMVMSPAQSVGYVPVPRVAKPDPTLSYIAADEPVVQAGFPPLPDRADLPGSGNSWAGSARGGGSGGSWAGPGGGVNGADGPGGAGGLDSRIEKKSYNGYRHAEAGAYAPQEPTRHYRSSNTASDSYSAGGGGGGGGGGGVGGTAPNPVASLGKEPSLNPRADAGIVADAPAPIVVKQATTQDLSLPDDEFSGSSTQQKKNPNGNRMLKQMGRQMFIQPMMQMSSMGSSMAGRAIHF